jgi:hypothetical protein
MKIDILRIVILIKSSKFLGINGFRGPKSETSCAKVSLFEAKIGDGFFNGPFGFNRYRENFSGLLFLSL